MLPDDSFCLQKWLEKNQDQDKGRTVYRYVHDPQEAWDAPSITGLRERVPLPGSSLPSVIPQGANSDGMNSTLATQYSTGQKSARWITGPCVLDKLEELGLEEDTALIFSSDHGILLGRTDYSENLVLLISPMANNKMRRTTRIIFVPPHS